MGKLSEELIQHLKGKLASAEARNFELYGMYKEAKEQAGLYTGLYHELKAEVSGNFSQHSINPQLLFAYMEGREALALAELEVNR